MALVIALPLARMIKAKHSETSSFCSPSILEPSRRATSSLTMGSTLGWPLTNKIMFSMTTLWVWTLVWGSPSALRKVVYSCAAIALAESAYLCWINFKAKKI